MTTVELLDSSLTMVATVKTFYPLDGQGTILRYSKELSDFGTATFRVSSYDTMFTTVGDVAQPLAFHVRIRRNQQVVWQGAIVENPKRTKDFIEIVAVEYIWFLNKILVTRSSYDPAYGPTAQGLDSIYRIFSSNSADNVTPYTTMSEAVTRVINETIARWSATNHVLANMTVGQVDNPNYPPNMTNGETPPVPLSGPWMFGDGLSAPSVTFTFHSVMYVLKSFANYTYADFNITVADDGSLQFNFFSFLGNDRHYDVNFNYGKHGNVVDFNVTRLGQRMVNDLWGLAVDPNGLYLNYDQTDEDSIQENGLLEQVSAYTDIKDQATLNARTAAELPLISTPDSSANTFVVSEKAFPIGVWDVGDIVNTKVDHVAIQFEEVARVVGYTVALNSTGRELTTVQTNKPLPWQYGDSGAPTT